MVNFCLQAYGFLEVFSGDGWVSKCVKANSIPTASFDIRLGGVPNPGKMDPMNLLSDAGFASFGWIGITMFALMSSLRFAGIRVSHTWTSIWTKLFVFNFCFATTQGWFCCLYSMRSSTTSWFYLDWCAQVLWRFPKGHIGDAQHARLVLNSLSL